MANPSATSKSKLFSTQIPAIALQSMELVSGSPNAQYGDKTSLVVNATSRSALGVTKAFGNIDSEWGSSEPVEQCGARLRWAEVWKFHSSERHSIGHFLDTPERLPIHDRGNNESIFDHFDWQPSRNDVFHLNFFVARNWFQTPNSYDSASPGSKRARIDVERGARVPTYVWRAHAADDQSVCASGSCELLREPGSV